jgi:hypothetical protein
MLLLPLTILTLAKESTKTSKVLKVLVFKTIKLKKPTSKIDQLTKELQKLLISSVT